MVMRQLEKHPGGEGCLKPTRNFDRGRTAARQRQTGDHC